MIDWVASLPPLLVLVLAVLIIAGEPALLVGVVLPSVSAALLVGFVAYTGALPLPVAIGVIAAAAVVGDGWAHRAGTRELTHLPDRLQPAWDRAARLVDAHGVLAVAAARWAAGLRTLLPRVVGAAGMPARRFAAVDVVTSVVWAGAYVGAGYLAGSSYAVAGVALGRAAGAVLGLVVLAALVVLAGRLVGRNPDPVLLVLRLLPRAWVANTVRRALLGRRSRPWRLVVGILAVVGLTGALSAALLLGLGELVQLSGLRSLDDAVVRAVRDGPDEPAAQVTDRALALLAVLRGSVVVAVAAGVSLLVLAGRDRSPQAVLRGAGVFVPLAVLALAVHLALPSTPGSLFQSQVAVVGAAVALAAWTTSRGRSHALAVLTGTVAALVVLPVALARVYLGWQSPSSVLLCLVLGLFWAVLLATAVVQAQAGRSPAPAPYAGSP